jgi:DNA-binding NtrC family response regulator
MIQALGPSVFFGDHFSRKFAYLQMPGSESEGPAATQSKVLVVDDERLLADTTATILRRAGFIAETAYDAFGALDVMASFHPHYVLTDIMMPAMNGVELAIAITKMYPKTKVLLFSGQAGITEILEESKTKGFEFPLLAKPVPPSKLIEGIRSLGHH